MKIVDYKGEVDSDIILGLIESEGQQTWARKALWYSSVDYSYSGIFHKARMMPDYIQRLAREMEVIAGEVDGYYDCCLINYFPKGKGIGHHKDDEEILREADGSIGSISTLSLGGACNIFIKGAVVNESFKVMDRTVYTMPKGDFQDTHTHGIGNCASIRISLTFRHLGNQ